MDFSKYIDISPLISNETAVFPGDQVFQRDEVMSCKKGDHLTLSSIKTTVHIGAHADASNHYHKEGVGISERSLNYYLGACQVVDVSAANSKLIKLSDIELSQITQKRVLFKTMSFPNPNHWTNDFMALSVELIKALSAQGVITLGIDTPSVDPATSKTLEAHHCIYQNNLAILEGLVLNKVPSGLYELIALPLKIKDCDASPVRAILLPKN